MGRRGHGIWLWLLVGYVSNRTSIRINGYYIFLSITAGLGSLSSDKSIVGLLPRQIPQVQVQPGCETEVQSVQAKSKLHLFR